MAIRFNPIVCATLLVTMTPALALAGGNLGSEPVVFESGNFTVRRGADAMTDKVTCVGIYKKDFGIQLSPGTLFIRVRGGIEHVQLRLDDNAPDPGRMATEVEQKIDSIAINGMEFQNLLGAYRLRTSILTRVSGVQENDLDLTGISEAYQNITNGCPGDPVQAKAAHAAAAPAVADGCSDRAKVKMKIRGLSDADIKDICTK